MLILTLRTDKPEAEIGLFMDTLQQDYYHWTAHRQLAETLHLKIRELLNGQAKDWHDIQGIVCFEGPGSFTGLRIGISVVNALASSLNVPLVGTQDNDWIEDGISQLLAGKDGKIVIPYYGADPHITTPRK
jgi:tRNA threonylcarbamoyladenosine biosynthesis protein TsaB